MTTSRKDNKGRVLRKGETQRSCDGKYVYTYTDPDGKRRSIYSKDIGELRRREEMLTKDQLDGLNVYVADNTRRLFLCLFEKITHSGCTDTHEHFYKIRT